MGTGIPDPFLDKKCISNPTQTQNNIFGSPGVVHLIIQPFKVYNYAQKPCNRKRGLSKKDHFGYKEEVFEYRKSKGLIWLSNRANIIYNLVHI